MSRFSTEFPIHKSVTKEQFLELIKKWLIENRNSKFKKSMFTEKKFFEPNKYDKWELSNEKLSYISIDTERDSEFSIKYEKIEPNIHYILEVTFSSDRENDCKWVGIHITNTAKTANTNLPPINKPKLIGEILDNICAKDALLNVQATAHYFSDDEINLAHKLIDGDSVNHLPIVYISIPTNGKHILKADELADKLSGIAHVIVEPNRKFSRYLSKLTNGKNTFSGYVGVYWPKGEGRNIIFRLNDKNKIKSMSNEISKVVIQAVSNRRQLNICSWSYIFQKYYQYNNKRIAEYDELLDTASDETEDLRRKLECMDKKLSESEREIIRLKQNLYDSNKSVGNPVGIQKSIEFICTEKDLYPNEIKDIILEILNQAKISCDKKSLRKLHILESVLNENKISNTGKKIKEDLKKILKGYSSMSPKIKKDLEKLGFELEEGKHHNLYFGDKRYSFSLARSPSDKRAVDNWISDFCKKMSIG